jgi:hypothetical protein
VKLHVYEQKKLARGLQVELKEDDSMKMTLLLKCCYYSFKSSMMCASTMVGFKHVVEHKLKTIERLKRKDFGMIALCSHLFTMTSCLQGNTTCDKVCFYAYGIGYCLQLFLLTKH